MRIALFVTCLADTLFPQVGRATAALLERLGHRVEFPAGQTCCGQMHVNTGYQRHALPLIRRYAQTFTSYEAIVVPSGSCVGSVRHQHAMVARRFGEDDLARQAEDVATRTFELSVFLTDVLGLDDVGAYTRTASPIIRPAIRCACFGSPTGRCGCCATWRGSISSNCRMPRSAAGSAEHSRSRTPMYRPRC